MKEVCEKDITDKANPILIVLKGAIIGFAVTAVIFTVYALMLTYTSMTGENMSLVVTLSIIFSAFISGFISSKKMTEKGWLWGITSGLIYGVLVIIAGVLTIEENLEIGADMVTMLVMCLGAGGLGGMIGINMRKK